MPCSGKGEFGEVARDMGFEVIKFGSIVKEEAQRRGIDRGALTLSYTGDLLRREIGPDWVARRIVEKMRAKASEGAELFFLEGMRTPSEVALIEKEFPSLVVVGLVASKMARFSRARSRGRWDDPASDEELEKKDKIEASWGVEAAIDEADYLLENEGSLEDFRKDARSLLESLVGGGC